MGDVVDFPSNGRTVPVGGDLKETILEAFEGIEPIGGVLVFQDTEGDFYVCYAGEQSIVQLTEYLEIGISCLKDEAETAE